MQQCFGGPCHESFAKTQQNVQGNAVFVGQLVLTSIEWDVEPLPAPGGLCGKDGFCRLRNHAQINVLSVLAGPSIVPLEDSVCLSLHLKGITVNVVCTLLARQGSRDCLVKN